MFGPVEIPNKSSFKINEVCALTGVKSYVLRFWESEFTEIAPIVSSVGLKLYEHRDIEAILLIKKLLFEDKFTIERAKLEMKILMPRESLVEDNFSESFIDELNDEEFFDDEHSRHHSSDVVYPIRESQKEALTKRVLIESDFQKLVMAKSKLAEILKITKVLHEKNNWD
jgi:DNA-binding transcriptional MerR regulator